MKFLVPNYSCLQNPWLRDYRPQIPVLSVLNWICWTPSEKNSWVRHWLVSTRSQWKIKLVRSMYLPYIFPTSRATKLRPNCICLCRNEDLHSIAVV